jgi:exonuclease III
MYSTLPSSVTAPGGGPNSTPPPNTINIATVNVDGLKSKFNALKAFIASDQMKILSITETHTQNPIHVPNFSAYSRPYTFNNFRRGVALLIDSNINSIKHDLSPHLSNLEAVAADAQLNNKSITIISY